MDKKNKHYFVSIIIPTYNVEAYIRECLESVAAQTYEGNIECIIVDDCGTDDSIAVAEQFIAEYKGCIDFRILHREKNGGLSAARNSGTDAATGDYIFYLDSDDLLFPNSIADLMAIAERYPHADIVQGKMVSTNGVEAQYKKQQSSEIITKKTELLKLLLIPGENSVSSWNRLYRRLLIVDNKLRFCEGIIFEDVDFNFRISQYVNSIAFCKERTYLFRAQRDGSITNTINECRCAKDSLLIYESALKRITSSSRRITYRSVFLYAQGNMRALPDNEEIKNGYKRLINHLCDVATLFDSILIRVYFFMPLRLRNNRMIYRLYKKYYSS